MSSAERGSKRLVFDITDLINHARRGGAVSGVQRVMINVIGEACLLHGQANVRCVFFHRHLESVVECDPQLVCTVAGNDAQQFLYRLGLLRNWRWFPSDVWVRRETEPYRRHKLRRAWKKLYFYATALLRPAKLHQLGARSMGKLAQMGSKMPLQPTQIGKNDSLLMFGAGWEPGPMEELARRHAVFGGSIVVMIYDLIPYRFPEFMVSSHVATFNNWLHRVVEYATRYICISQSTAADLQRFLASRSMQRPVIPILLAHELLGFARNQVVTACSPEVLGVTAVPFVLCVGTFEIRKNGVMLLRAWQRLQAELGEQLPILVFAGRRGWLMDEFDAVLNTNPELQQKVTLVISPSDQDLAALYSNCLFTAFVSHYEGWGLPIGEAAWLGKFCIASNTSSMPEVCGDLVDYVSPADLEELVTALRRAIVDVDYRRRRELGIRAAPLRTWRDVAREIVASL